MFESSVSISPLSPSYSGDDMAARRRPFPDGAALQPTTQLTYGVLRRWRREVRRRKVGRAYDMALEIARVIPRGSRLLDVGCGNGFIAHHLAAMLGASVLGIDLAENTEAPIDYRSFDGTRFPVEDDSVDAVLLCYVLHHAQKLEMVMSELRRVLSAGGFVVVYEDIPEAWWDRFVCWTHDLKWRKRTGTCAFRRRREWRTLFNSAGFEIISERQLARWRNLTHPVCRRYYLLRRTRCKNLRLCHAHFTTLPVDVVQPCRSLQEYP